MTPEQTLTKLLSLCAEHGYNAVAIGMRHKAVPQSIEFPFRCSDCIFANPKDEGKSKIDGSPAIWSITRQVGLKASCGNSHQHQIYNLPFHPQVWQLKCGEWTKIAEELPNA